MPSEASMLVVVATEAEVPPAASPELLVCGVGKTAAATATALRLAKGGVRAVVSFGVAGAYPMAGLELGDVVVASEVALLDEGLETGNRFKQFACPDIPVPGADWAPTSAELRALMSRPDDAGFAVATGRIATVSVCAGTDRLARERAQSGAIAEGMEGAAIAYAASRCDVPFVEVRGISNACGPREGAPFQLALAVRNAGVVLAQLAQARA